ncbi:hypothetical protein HYT53_02965 [Candidatus Woesearchaeota archaeon]|nr:hypothetical protein [Candidatus Woesearchaeota archaeon]
MVKVGVLGHTGRLGKPLVEILKHHPYAEIVYTHSTSEPSKITLSESKAELLFSALGEGASKEYEHEWRDIRVIDLSIDHRYHPEWTYGLPELNRGQIKGAQYVANPGCYATSIILGLAPIKHKVSEVSIQANSGISGAGLEKQEEDNFGPYKEGQSHEQIPEIERSLGLHGITLFPQRLDNTDRGIISTIFAKIEGSEDLLEIYRQFYASESFVRVQNQDYKIEVKKVNRTNFCDIKTYRFGERITVVSTLDNLIKGGSGQAVQNFNLMYGFDETLGLV